MLKADGRVSGDVFGMREQGDHGASADTFGVGWNLDPQYRGHGYALGAARALFAHLFTGREARWLYAYVAYVDAGNDASERLCERLACGRMVCSA